jgi:hypothetical protein
VNTGGDSTNKLLPLKLRRLSLWVALWILPTLANAQAPTEIRALYQKLAGASLDPAEVYSIRDGAIDREDIHLSFTDGVVAFMRAVDGKVTGMVFAGEGEVLVVPPNLTERQSLALFTKSAVLSEQFYAGYFRFFDDQFIDDLRPSLLPALKDEAAAFITRHDALARNLAQTDALRLLVSMTGAPRPKNAAMMDGEFIRARLSSAKLGTFDTLIDSALAEEVVLGKASQTEQGVFYDQWAMFPMRTSRQSKQPIDSDVAVISDYKIRTRVTPPTDIESQASLRVNVNRSGDRVLIFELSRTLKVTSVTLGEGEHARALEFLQNESVEGTQQSRIGNDFVAVGFPQPLQSGASLILNFTYSGPVMEDAGGGLLYVGARGAWYPNRGFWMSNFDLEFRTPVGWKLLATGDPVSQETVGNEEVSRWRSTHLIPVAGFNLGRYVMASAKAQNGTVVEAYAARAMEDAFTKAQIQRSAPPPISPRPWWGRRAGFDNVLPPPVSLPEPARNASAVAESSASFIDFLTPRVGPFPFTRLALTQIPGSSSQGWPGLVYLSSYVFLTPQERWRGKVNLDSPDEILFGRVMTAHETAHQWWGDAIVWRSYRDQWMMEALSNYTALLKLEAEDPARFRIVMDAYREGLLDERPGGKMKDAGAVTLGLRLNSSKFPDSYEAITYGRGTWLIHMLRHMLRDAPTGKLGRVKSDAKGLAAAANEDKDAAFFAVIRRLRERFDGKVMSTADLRYGFEESLPTALQFEGKRSLEWFFEYWVGGTAIPRLSLEKLKITGTNASAILRQKDAPELIVTSVPIYAENAAGKLTFIQRVFADGEETDLRLRVPAGTKRLVLDPYYTVLRQ